MPRNLYLHEVVDITGQGAVPYMEHTVDFHAETAADRGLTLLGTWYVVGATGRWPQVINIWELVDGWKGWERLVRSTNIDRGQNQALSEWWDEAYRHRSGGVDRLMAAGPGCPSLAELSDTGVTGELFVHELSTVKPGLGLEYLDALTDRWAPVMADHGHRLVGAYEVLMRDTEVCTVWATDLPSHVSLMQASTEGGDDRIAAWRSATPQWLTGWHEELMVPHRGTLLATS